MLLIAGEWIAVWSVIGATVIGASWWPLRRFRERRLERRHLEQRLRSNCR